MARAVKPRVGAGGGAGARFLVVLGAVFDVVFEVVFEVVLEAVFDVVLAAFLAMVALREINNHGTVCYPSRVGNRQ
jgi:hypothetical protein